MCTQLSRIWLRVVAIIDIIIKRIFAYGLDIDSWHINNSFYTSKYKVDVVKFIDTYKPDIVFDLGCGLSDINRRVKKQITRVSIDSCKNALKISGRLDSNLVLIRSNFFHFPNDLINSIRPLLNSKSRPLFVLINVAHTYKYSTVTNLLDKIFQAHPGAVIIVDSYVRTQNTRLGSSNKLTHMFYEYKKSKLSSNNDRARDIYLLFK